MMLDPSIIMGKEFLFFIIVMTVFAERSIAQDTLPKITVKNINNLIIVSWKNNYGAKVSNINIQRSKDSLKNFITIGTVLNPLNKENGFVDHKTSAINFFYRVFVAFEGGTYIFSRSQHPVVDPVKAVENTVTNKPAATPEVTEPITHFPITTVPKTVSEPAPATVPATAPITAPVTIVEDPLSEAAKADFLPHIKIPKSLVPVGFVPSKFIFTNKENNLVISLPDAEKLKYSLRFFDDKNKPLFEIKKITEPYLLMEKVNFIRSGWFYYTLYDDGIFLEKYKFYISKDGRFGPLPPEQKNITTDRN